MSAILEYQKAVYAALQADASLIAQVQGIYDSVTQNAVAPYVYFGDVAAETAENLAKNAVKISFTIFCVTETLGKLQAAQIAENVRAIIHRANLVVAGYDHINTRFVEQEISLANNGINYFAEVVFEGVVTD
jgi:ubiquinone biosynthesis protein UbiJ